jgi:hypothetical protein
VQLIINFLDEQVGDALHCEAAQALQGHVYRQRQPVLGQYFVFEIFQERCFANPALPV